MAAIPSDEGYVKYRAERRAGHIAWSDDLAQLSRVRAELFARHLIGVYPNGIGFGNLSVRGPNGSFFISGTATGALPELGAEHFCQVEWFSLEENRVRTFGPIDASSESMTHGAIYRASAQIEYVVHVHDRRLFDHLLSSGAPCTPPDVPYGTPAMARAVGELIVALPSPEAIFAMAGHEEGVIACAPTLETARDLLLGAYERSRVE